MDVVQDDKKMMGLVIVHTGNGKGKTTAALGLLMRAWGQDLRVGMLQFIKNSQAVFGETKAAQRMGIRLVAKGSGRTSAAKDLEKPAEIARQAWKEAQRLILSGDYDLLVLDEFTFPLTYGWLDTGEIIEWIKVSKPPSMHLVITGRYAPQSLIDFADLVTEMTLVKHPYKEQNIIAQPGIEY